MPSIRKPQALIVISHAQQRESEKKKTLNVVYCECIAIFPSLVQVEEIGSVMLDG